MEERRMYSIEELEKMVAKDRVKVNNLFKQAKKSLGALSSFSSVLVDYDYKEKSMSGEIVKFHPVDPEAKRANLTQEYHELQSLKRKLSDVEGLKKEAKYIKQSTKEYLSHHLKVKISDTGLQKFKAVINNISRQDRLKIESVDKVFQKAKSMGYSDEAYELLSEEDAEKKIKELIEDNEIPIFPDDEEQADFGF